VNLKETKGLLAYISAAWDNRVLSEATATFWHEELAGVPVDVAKAAVRAHFTGGDGKPAYLDLATLLAGCRRIMRRSRGAMQADVRSAKARRMIDADWSESEPLPDDVSDRLYAARSREAAEKHAIETRPIENPVRFELGAVGRGARDA
jgi:hypothetical protein